MDKRLILWTLLLLGFIGTAAFGDLNSGLVAHWEFEGDFKDTAGTNDGAAKGDAKIVADAERGQVLELDGTGDYVEVPNSPSLDITGDRITLAAWVRHDDVTGNPEIIIAKVVNNTTHSSPYFSYGLHILNPSGHPRIWISRTGGAANATNAAMLLQSGKWHHLAGVYDGAQLRLYLDGKSIASSPVTGTIIGYDAVLRLGINGGLTEPMDGKMDDVRIYDRALSEREVVSLATGVSLNAAWNPSPTDGATDVTSPLLTWSAGDNTVFHYVYLGTTEELTQADQVAGPLPLTSAMHFHTQGLAPDTKYYWRVDEIAVDQSRTTGQVWSFTTPPLTAYAASPADGARFINPAQPQLTWKSGMNAFTHDVYFGDNSADVTNGTGGASKGNQATNSLAPGTLAYGKTYYWRIDEVALDQSKTTGQVWSFTTIPEIPIADPTLVGWWRLDEGEGTTVVDWSGQGHHGTLNGKAQWVDGVFGGALDIEYANTHDGVVIPPFDVAGDGITLAGWVKPESFSQADGRIITKATGVNENDHYWMLSTNASGSNYVLRVRLKTDDGQNTTTLVASTGFLVIGEWAHAAATWDGTSMVLYKNGVEVARGVKGGNAPAANATLGVAIGNHFSGTTGSRSWDGLIDDVRVYSHALSAEQIAQIMVRSNPLAAYEPQPAPSAAVDIRDAVALEWSPGDTAASHDVYFGTSKDAVKVADTTSPEYVVRQTAATFSLQGLVEFGGAYFWRVDEVEADGTTIHTGDVWGCTVYDYLLVDNFESYANESPFRLFQTWLDSYGYSADDFFPTAYNGNGTGAGVGHDIWTDTSLHYNGSIAERGLVNSGRQSMPLYFDNTASPFYSETERTWTSPQDWTVGGVDALVLHIHGNPSKFVQTGPAGFILSGAGADIYGTADQCRYVYKQLTGDGAIIARGVRNGSGTNLWSKGGVMIRAAVDAGATNATTLLTGGNGAGGAFQYRTAANAATTAVNNPSPAVTLPYWVKIERVGNSLSGYFSPDGVTWKQHGTTQTIIMTDPVLIGICVTSHAANQLRAYEFDDISTTGKVTGQWQVEDIGVAQGGNEQPEPLYVMVQDKNNRSVTLVHPDADIALSEAWTQWKIPLTDFTGVNMTGVKKMWIGLGDRKSPKAGGAGLIYIDDIRVIRPE